MWLFELIAFKHLTYLNELRHNILFAEFGHSEHLKVEGAYFHRIDSLLSLVFMSSNAEEAHCSC